MAELPEIGAVYQHYKGGLYTVVAIATHEGSHQRMVVYRGADGHVWTRPLSEWFDVLEPSPIVKPGHTVTRFAYVAPVAASTGGT